MIIEVTGDILLSKADALAHGIAPHDDFKSGLAHSLKEAWPGLYKDFRHYCKTTNPSSGEIWSWAGPGAKIINLMTQEAPEDSGRNPRKAKTSYVNHALKNLRKIIETEGLKSVALPRLATGVGGLSWDEVQPLINQHLGDLKIPVYIYTTYQKGVAAKEV
jgi:O-acetyl-ADP-ribose deacetylase (regulator of RNase III)